MSSRTRDHAPAATQRSIHSTSIDGTVRIWDLDIDDLLALARDRVTRSLTDEECQEFLHHPCAQPATS